MENFDKENFMSLRFSAFDTQDFQRIAKPLLDSQANKTQNKQNKNLVSNVRVGDWICLICNNLNYSFRDECNRCQMQTKRQNLLQGLKLATENQNEPNLGERKPLKDLTNQKHLPHPHNIGSSFLQTLEESRKAFMNSEKYAPKKQVSETFDDQKGEFSYFSNCGFDNALLLTPPRVLQEVKTYEEFGSSNSKDFPAYRSPKDLPSVSPFLKKLSLKDFEKDTKLSNHSRTKLSFSESREADDIGFLQNLNKRFDETFEDDPDFPSALIGRLERDEKKKNQNSSRNLDKEDMIGAQMYLNKEDNHKKNIKIVKQDWICQGCNNLNYSFRKFCNRCQLLR